MHPEKNFSKAYEIELCQWFVLLLSTGKEFFQGYHFESCLWFCFFGCLFVCGHNNSWKAQPIQTKFLHMTFDWNSSAKFEDGHRRWSQVTFNPPNRGLLTPPPPPWKFTYLRFQPIQTKFSHMTFDWNSLGRFGNGHHRSHVTPLIGGFCPPGKFKYLWFWWNLILMHYPLNKADSHNFSFFRLL